MSEPEPRRIKITGMVQVPNELRADQIVGTWPSEKQRARWARIRAEEEEKRQKDLKRHAQLISAGGLLAKIVEHHKPHEENGQLYCYGCDPSGYDAEYGAGWPCSTWDLLTEVEL